MPRRARNRSEAGSGGGDEPPRQCDPSKSNGTALHPARRHEENKRRSSLSGLLLLLGAAVLWSLNGVLIQFIHDDGAGPHGVVIAFYRSLFAGLFLIPFARGRFHTLRCAAPPSGTKPRGDRASRYRVRPAAILCVVFFTLMTVCFVVANTQTEASNAILLQYTSTFWIFALSPLVLNERPHTSDLWILGLAMIGVGVIFVGNMGAGLLGLMNGLAAGLFFGLLTLMIRRLRDCDAAAVTVVNNLGSALLILPFAFLVGGLSASPWAFVLLVTIGVVQFGLPYYLFTLGVARVPAHQAALIILLEPVLVPVWTYLGRGEIIPPPTRFGGSAIIAALILYAVVIRRRQRALESGGVTVR